MCAVRSGAHKLVAHANRLFGNWTSTCVRVRSDPGPGLKNSELFVVSDGSLKISLVDIIFTYIWKWTGFVWTCITRQNIIRFEFAFFCWIRIEPSKNTTETNNFKFARVCGVTTVSHRQHSFDEFFHKKCIYKKMYYIKYATKECYNWWEKTNIIAMIYNIMYL